MLSFKEQQVGSDDLPARWNIGVERRQVVAYVSIALIAGFAIGFTTARYFSNTESVGAVRATATEAASRPAALAPAEARAGEFHRVTRIIRADTVEVDKLGTVRLIGIETPDGKLSRDGIDTHGKNALSFTEKSLLDQEVRLEFDPANSARDNKDNARMTLAYVYLKDGTLFNSELVRQGHAFVLASEQFSLIDDFRARERDAMQALRGVWGTGAATPATASVPALPGSPDAGLDSKPRKLTPLLPSELGPNVPAVSGAQSGSISSTEPVVLASAEDRMYHKAGCESLPKKRQAKSLSQARSEGYTACSRCFASTLLRAP